MMRAIITLAAFTAISAGYLLLALSMSSRLAHHDAEKTKTYKAGFVWIYCICAAGLIFLWGVAETVTFPTH
jgi:hypothetical protein